jgi:hypothetical protein
MATVTSKNKAEFDEAFMAKKSGQKEEKHFSEKPMAAEGLNSYRYQGRYGHIMIGAKDHDDALREAQRSTRDKVEHKHLESWDKEEGKYKPIQMKKSGDSQFDRVKDHPKYERLKAALGKKGATDALLKELNDAQGS